jgi:hypothetical protein
VVPAKKRLTEKWRPRSTPNSSRSVAPVLKGLLPPLGAGAPVMKEGPMSSPKNTPRSTSSTGASVAASTGAEAWALAAVDPRHSPTSVRASSVRFIDSPAERGRRKAIRLPA